MSRWGPADNPLDLGRLYVLIKNFCGTTTEGSLRKNALLIEEILSEIVNRGHIYTTDLSSLRPCIYSEPADTPALKKTVLTSTLLALDTKSVVPNTTALRPVFGSRLEQSQNQQKAEIFVDVVEKVYASISKENPTAQMLFFPTTFLHDTVRSEKFAVDRTLTVLAPQGEVPVLRYCTTRPNNGYPFTIVTAVEDVPCSRDLVLTVKLRCEGHVGSEAVGTTLEIALPCNTSGIMKRFNELEQSAEFQYENKKIIWRIKCLKAKSEAVAKFRSTSGLKIRFLKADQHSGGNIQRWIRYVTTSDCWVQRLT
ncbi:hypothetical protein HPB51_012628 [Rhipicephalus microplus]|uniref:MHD domain-containing protein n=1 Tax=Rhipicephalus microplus TaxID=6941 RepID=A0A9J6E1C8_RHIMP|nr:hypothetical protein HPB51_012628 [Rhipicephalus microplus]